MRLHSLEITAFGAFGGTEKVDFDELGSDGLFLLHGQTGAGKTTVLDAVAYALYGTVPGSRQSGKRLHSDHAPRDRRPQVVLEATIGGRDLRLTRSPEFRRPKLRGDGFTDQPASGTLEWLDGSGENLSRINDIGSEIVRLLGMSAEQFFQVVLLPQGEFAKFLKADTRDRATLLEKLFDTSRFKSVEEWFADRRRLSAEKLSRQRRSIDIGLASLSTAAGVENFEPTDEQPTALGWAHALVADCEERARVTEKELQIARAESDAAGQSLVRIRGQAHAQGRATEASAQLEAYIAAAAERAQLEAEGAQAARAEKVQWAHESFTTQRQDQAQLLDRVAGLEKGLAADATAGPTLAATRTPEDELDRGALADSVREWSAELTRLQQAQELEESMDRDSRGLETARDQREKLSSTAEQAATQLAELPAAIEAAADKVVAAQQAQSELPGLRSARDDAAVAADAAAQLVSATAAQTKARKKVETAKTAWNDARGAALDLRERRLNGMAAELAAALVEGEACAVCGSLEHPKPAVTADDLVTKDDEELAQEAVGRASTALEKAQLALQEADGAVIRFTEKTGGLDMAAATQAAMLARSLFERSQEIAAGLEVHKAQSAALAARREELEKIRVEAESGARVAAHTEAQLAQKQEQDKAKLALMIGSDASAAARSARIRAARDGAEELVELLGLADTARRNLAKARASLEEAVEQAQFSSVDDALAAVRSSERRTEIAEALSDAAEQSASARAVLAEPEILAVKDLEPAPVDEAEQTARTAAGALEAALRVHEKAEGRRGVVADKFAGLKSEIGKLAPIESRHEELASLADLMVGGGANLRKMSLGTYVLAARLEEVAVVASRRLRAMSGGRFEFVHSDGKVNREIRGGLALNILDANTGSERPTSTLSGGETFMASLSLALGLADVVAEESGGIQLETLFIDEGFGTLDAEALDLVMGVLDELRAGGRAVGIVSHVAEMQHRIPNRLFVKKGESGSTLHMRDA